MLIEDNITLHYCQGSSDKIYKLSLVPEDSGWLVNFAYGRRNKPLKTGTKTPKPISYTQAQKAYEKVIRDKMAKGYMELSNSGTIPRINPNAGKETGYLPQLVNEIPEEEAVQYFADKHFRASPEYSLANTTFVQIKHDGERRGIIFTPDEVIPANKRGLLTTIEPKIEDDLFFLANLLGFGGTFDTEDMGEYLVIFDILADGPTSLLDTPFWKRAQHLYTMNLLLCKHKLKGLKVDVPFCPANPEVFFDFLNHAKFAGEEGIILRDGNALYTPGAPNSGGPVIKVKFKADATVLVSSVHPTKRSVGISAWIDLANWVPVGNCTIPPNRDIPAIGDFIDVEYLYAYKGGSIYQPVFKRLRTDVTKEAASVNKLKWKKGT